MTIIQGDCLEEMRKMECNSISAIVTDPPYGLSFMGKGWDYAVPGVEYWSEALRLCRPGGHLLAMGGSRTYHRLACAIEDAGYQIRDTIMWIYGSGFPKSRNHFGLEGFGTALKPGFEPIIMAMKPCDGTFKQNAEKWGQAGINIDGCRIESDECWKRDCRGQNMVVNALCDRKGIEQFSNEKGRWPANVILDEDAANMLDEQSGILKTGELKGYIVPGESPNGQLKGKKSRFINYSTKSSGGASRFFYCAKASASERNGGSSPRENTTKGELSSEGGIPKRNNHPTVKPIKLMEYLIKLVMPGKDGILLDPFCGSGTTILAAKRLGFEAIGIEKSPEYCEIAKARIAAFSNKDEIRQMSLFTA